jgi:hypothetical protein
MNFVFTDIEPGPRPQRCQISANICRVLLLAEFKQDSERVKRVADRSSQGVKQSNEIRH